MAPDLRRKVDAARAARLAREAGLKKQVEAQVSKIEVRLLPCWSSNCFSFFLLLFDVHSLPLHPDINWRAERSHETNMGDKVNILSHSFISFASATNVIQLYYIMFILFLVV